MSNISLFDLNRPAEGSVVTGQELRELLQAVATSNAGPTEPVGDAVFIGDVRFSSVSGSIMYKLAIDINGVSQVVDIRSLAANSASITPTEVVAAINDAFSGSFGGESVAYVYGTETNDSSSFIALIAPRTIATPYITLSNTGDGADAIDTVFGVTARGHGMPYTVTKQSAQYGMTWLKTDTNDGDIRIYLGSTAKVTGYVNLAAGSGTVNLSTRGKLRILLVGPTAVWPASGLPLDVNIQGSSPSATTPSEIVSAINTAFTALPGWTGQGPASLVTREGSGQYLQIVAGPSDNPYIGSLARVELSNLSLGGPLGVNYLIDDAINDVFGLPRGEGEKKFTRIPYIFRGAYFSSGYIRGISDRRGAGIGVWGSSMDSSRQIPFAGNIDGEVRVAKDASIPWVYRQSEGGWRRLIPGYVYPIRYSKSREAYTISSTSDTFVPHPLNYLGYSNFEPVIAPDHSQTGEIGDVVTLTDGRDPSWLVGNYTGARSPSILETVWDNFRITGSSLGRTWHGIRWNTYEDTASQPTRMNISVSGIATTNAAPGTFADPVRAVIDGAGSPVTLARPAGFVSGGTYSTTIPGVSASQPIRAGTLHVWITVTNTDQSTLGSSGVYAYKGFDNGSGAIGGTGFSGTINYTTGAIVLNSLSLQSYENVSVAYSQASSPEVYTVSCEVRRSGRASHDGSPCQAGLIYKAHNTPGSYAIDAGSGFAVVIDDGGVGLLYSIDNHVPEPIGAPFIVDPPLDDTWRTLRVLFTTDGTNTTHTVFWDGSNKPPDWLTKDYASPEANLATSQTSGGYEVDKVGKILTIQTIPEANITGLGGSHNLNITGHLPGIWALGVPAAGSLAVKNVEFRNFQQHGGQTSSIFQPSPALAPVSAVRLRDTINAVQVQANGTPLTSSKGDKIITDCTAGDPLVLNIVGDLVTNLDVDVDVSGNTGRKITLGYSVPAVLKNKDDRYSHAQVTLPSSPGYISRNDQTNINGRVARWSISEALVDAATVAGLPGLSSLYKGGVRGDVFDFGTRQDNAAVGPYSFATAFPTLGTSASASAAALPNLVWYPSTTGWAAGPIGNVQSSDLTWNRNVTHAAVAGWTTSVRVVEVPTTLPRDGYNGISWRYRLVACEITTQRSNRLQTLWATPSAGLWDPSLPIIDPTCIAFRNGNSYANLDPAYASFSLHIKWAGPVRPIGMRLEIEAFRVGIED